MKHVRLAAHLRTKPLTTLHKYFFNQQYCSSARVNAHTFESLGVDDYVTRGLSHAFPHVQTPTPVQEQFIPAILSGKDVLLQDQTGTGKSLGLLLALLSKPRASRHVLPRYWKERATKRASVKEAITSIVIVPHNDLAHQFVHWIKSMRLTNSPRELVQTLLKDAVDDYSEQLRRLSKQPPHILITTPRALDDCWKKGRHLFTLDAVSTVVLDEADSLLKIPSNNTPLKVQKRWRKHPPVVRELLADIFKLRPKNAIQTQAHQTSPIIPDTSHHMISPTPVQIILVSATLRPAVRKFLFLETKWVSHEPGQTVQIDGTRQTDTRCDPVRHYGLFVDVSGSIRNIRDPEVEEEEMLSDPNGHLSSSEVDETEHEDGVEMVESVDDREKLDLLPTPSMSPQDLLWTGNRLAPQLLDAIVSMFVLEVPEFALLIIPSNVSALRTVEDLGELGVTAINLDDYAAKPKETLHHLRSKAARSLNLDREDLPSIEDEGEKVMADNPVMLVAIQAAVRGIDLPQISHVMIAGVPESEVDYIHLAGRVGRLGAKSAPNEVKKVITFLPEPNMNPLIGPKALKMANEPRRCLERMWKMLGIKSSIYAKAI